MIKTGVYGEITTANNGMFENILDVAEFDIVGVYDPETSSKSSLVQKYNVRTFSEKNALIDNVDAVIALSPVIDLDDIKNLVKSSKHVFFEPTAQYCNSDVSKLSTIIDEANVKVQPGFHHRYDNTFLSARPFITYPRFIQSVNMRKYDRDSECCSVLMDMLVNDVDIVLSVVKSNVNKISANATSMHSYTPDVINVRIEFYNGCVAQLTAGRMAIENSHTMSFYCKNNYVVMDVLKGTASSVTKKTTSSESKLFEETIGDLVIEPIPVCHNNVYYDEFSSFAKSIIYNKLPEVNVDSLSKTYEIIKKIKEKIKLSF